MALNTWVVDVLVEIKVTASCMIVVSIIARVTSIEADVRCMVAKLWGNKDTFLLKVSHEELQTNQSKDAKAEHCQDHDISQLLH